jgi:hypothetical protein
MTENVWETDPDAEMIVGAEQFEIVVAPEAPGERVRDAEFANEEQDAQAREQALAHFTNSRFMGAWSPPPEIEQWPERYSAAFEEELARLEASAGRA